jgi:hypothetical protein
MLPRVSAVPTNVTSDSRPLPNPPPLAGEGGGLRLLSAASFTPTLPAPIEWEDFPKMTQLLPHSIDALAEIA